MITITRAKFKAGCAVIAIFVIINSLSHGGGIITTRNYHPSAFMGLNISPRTMPRRGGGVITVQSGCRMSKWVYFSPFYTFEWGCNRWSTPQPRINQLLHNASQLEENDTVYVSLTEVERFVNDVLDAVSTNIIVISGDWYIVEPASNVAIYKLLTHPRVLKWFCQNLPKYGGANPFHPKIAPFPYGLKEGGPHTRPQDYPQPNNAQLRRYTDVLFRSIQDDSLLNKTNFIFLGPLAKTTGTRSSIPQTRGRMEPTSYFLEMAKSTYVLSPNGDRPECHRHYEAIGLGTVPVTELDPFFFRHLGNGQKNGPVIFDTKEWDIGLLENELDPKPVVRRSMILEDFWMDWVDGVIGFRVNWNTYENGNGLTESENSLLMLLN
jgi:hypothetical protein